MKKIFIASSAFAEIDKSPLLELKKAGFEIVSNPYKRRLSEKEIITLGKGCVGTIAGLEKYTPKVIKSLPKLKVISRIGTGIDNIDMKAAKKRGISVFNTQESPVEAVSEFTIGLLLSLARNVPCMDKALKKGQWKKIYGTLIKGKVIGIIGLGRIGRRTAELLKAFHAEILAYDPFCDKSWLARNAHVKRAEFKRLLKKSDIILIHASGKNCIIGKKEIKAMKKGALIVNTSRGSIIDENALCKALEARHIGGIALDVFNEEPYNGKLKLFENAVLTPHVASHTISTRIQMEMESARSVINALREKSI